MRVGGKHCFEINFEYDNGYQTCCSLRSVAMSMLLVGSSHTKKRMLGNSIARARFSICFSPAEREVASAWSSDPPSSYSLLVVESISPVSEIQSEL